MKRYAIILFILLTSGLFLSACGTTQQSNTTATSSANGSTASYSLTEIAQHNNRNDCWMAVDGNVYDVTAFISQHPGGDRILEGCGKDASSIFHQEPHHQSGKTQLELKKHLIGTLTN